MSAPTMFRLPLSQVEGRLDPLYYSQTLRQLLEKSPHAKTKLGLLVDYMCTGFTAGKAEQTFNEGIIQIRPTNITTTGEFVFDRNVNVPSDLLHKQASDRLQTGEVLFNNTNSQELVGKTTFFDLPGDYFCSNHITRIKTRSAQLLPTYLCVLLNTYQRLGVFYRRCVNWNNQSGINTDALRNLEIPLPNLQTQEHIATLMHKAYTQKTELEAQAQALLNSVDAVLYRHLGLNPPVPKDESLKDRIFKVRLREIGGRFDPFFYLPDFFQFERKIKAHHYCRKLGSIGKIQRGVVYATEDETKDGIPVLRANNINLITGQLDLTDLVRIATDLDRDANKKIRVGDILICAASGSKEHAGKACFVNQSIDAYIGGFMMALRCHPSIHAEYVAYYLQSSLFRNQIYRHLGGTNINNISIGLLSDLDVLVPDFSSQETIAEEITSIHTQAQTLRQQAKNLLTQAQQKTEALILGKTQ